MPRLFTGLEIPPDVARQLAMHRGGLFSARWVEPEDYHITLRFLGDVDRNTARDAARLLADTGRGPIAVTLTQLDSFGGGRPRSIHAKVQATPGLVDLHNEHERLMRRLGLPPETRKFAPHVTLARLKDSSALAVADYLSLRPLIRPLSFTASRFVLYSARDSVGGGPYVVEAAYPLDSRLSRAI